MERGELKYNWAKVNLIRCGFINAKGWKRNSPLDYKAMVSWKPLNTKLPYFLDYKACFSLEPLKNHSWDTVERVRSGIFFFVLMLTVIFITHKIQHCSVISVKLWKAPFKACFRKRVAENANDASDRIVWSTCMMANWPFVRCLIRGTLNSHLMGWGCLILRSGASPPVQKIQ